MHDAEPFDPQRVKELVRNAIATDTYTYSEHARGRLRKWGINDLDCVNVLRAGWAEPGEWENGSWRYRIRTQRIVVVMAILCADPAEVLIVTAWKEDGR